MSTSNLPAYEPEAFRLPFPADFEDVTYATVAQRAQALLGAAERIYDLAGQSNQTIAISEDARVLSRDVFAGAVPPDAIQTTAEALHLRALLDAYDITVVQSAQQIRNFCTNHLIGIAGDEANKKSDRLRAIEMLGKIKDVSLFEERSTVLVQNMTTEQIKEMLRTKVADLRSKVVHAQTVEVHHAEETQAAPVLPAGAAG